MPRLNFADGVRGESSWIDVLPWHPQFGDGLATADGCPYLGQLTVHLLTHAAVRADTSSTCARALHAFSRVFLCASMTH